MGTSETYVDNLANRLLTRKNTWRTRCGIMWVLTPSRYAEVLHAQSYHIWAMPTLSAWSRYSRNARCHWCDLADDSGLTDPLWLALGGADDLRFWSDPGRPGCLGAAYLPLSARCES